MLCDVGTGEEEANRRGFHVEYEVTSTLSNYKHQPSLVCSQQTSFQNVSISRFGFF